MFMIRAGGSLIQYRGTVSQHPIGQPTLGGSVSELSGSQVSARTGLFTGWCMWICASETLKATTFSLSPAVWVRQDLGVEIFFGPHVIGLHLDLIELSLH
jgi:hypothetical protein